MLEKLEEALEDICRTDGLGWRKFTKVMTNNKNCILQFWVKQSVQKRNENILLFKLSLGVKLQVVKFIKDKAVWHTIPQSPILCQAQIFILLRLLAPSLSTDLDPGTACDAPVRVNEERSVLFPTLDHSQELDRAIQAEMKWSKMKLLLELSFRMVYWQNTYSNHVALTECQKKDEELPNTIILW